MNIKYISGPEKIRMGNISFQKGVSKEVDKDTAKKILNKKIIKFKKVQEER